MKELVKKAKKVGLDLLPCNKDKRPYKVKNFYETNILETHEAEILKGKYTGVIMKPNGSEIAEGKYLVMIDVDTHSGTPEAFALGEDLVAELQNKLAIICDTTVRKMKLVTEKTMNGGYHIYMTTDKVFLPKKQSLDYGVLLEMYSKARYCVTSPSVGYETESGLECIQFDECANIYVPLKKLINVIFPFSASDTKGNEKGLDTNTKFNPTSASNKQKFDSISKNWHELKTFLNGSTNNDWDSISESGAYDYVRFNIMPFLILMDKKDLFLEKIKNYGANYTTQWTAYPDRWLSIQSKDRPIGTDGRKYLREIGYLKDSKKETNSDLHDRFIKQVVPTMYDDCKLIENTPYVYDREEMYYMPVGFKKTETEIRNYFLNNEKKTMMPSYVSMLCNSTMKYLEAHASNRNVDWVKPYHMEHDYSYLDGVHIVFNNGTVIVSKKGFDFHEGKFYEETVPMFKLNVDWDISLTKPDKDSIVIEWFENRFPDKEAFKFIRMFFGNLLVPKYDPEVLISIVTPQGGTGKSTLSACLQRVFDPMYEDKIVPSKVLTIDLDKIGDKFIGWDLAEAIINISAETDGRLNNEAVKKMVTRERMQVERKGVDAFYIKPLAKHISFANKIPETIADGGMQRRLAVFTATETLIRPELDGTMYKKMFVEDYKSLIAFMLQGLKDLVDQNFPNMSQMWMNNEAFTSYRSQFRENNSSAERYMVETGYKLLLHGDIAKDELFESFKYWCNQNDIQKVLAKKHFHNHVISTGLVTDKGGNVRVEVNGVRKRGYTVISRDAIEGILALNSEEV